VDDFSLLLLFLEMCGPDMDTFKEDRGSQNSLNKGKQPKKSGDAMEIKKPGKRKELQEPGQKKKQLHQL
jgi:hypothetical protein